MKNEPDSSEFLFCEVCWSSADPDDSERQHEINLSDEQFRDLYENSIVPDIMEGTLGTSYEFLTYEDRQQLFSDYELHIFNLENRVYSLEVEKTAERTLKWLHENLTEAGNE